LRGKNQLTVYVGYVKWEHTDSPPCLERKEWARKWKTMRNRREKAQNKLEPPSTVS